MDYIAVFAGPGLYPGKSIPGLKPGFLSHRLRIKRASLRLVQDYIDNFGHNFN